MFQVVPLDGVQGTKLLVISSENENNTILEEAGRALRASDIKVALLVANPLIMVDIIDLTRLELHLFNVLVTSESVDFLPVDSYSGEETLLLQHGRLMEDVLFHELQTVISHSTNKEPRANVLVLLLGDGVTACSSTVEVDTGEVARELTLVFSYETPLGELFLLSTFHEETADLVSAEFKPEHIVGDVQVQMVLVSVGAEQLTLGQQVLLGVDVLLSHTFADHITLGIEVFFVHATAVDAGDLLLFVHERTSSFNFCSDYFSTLNVFSSRVF